MASVSSDRSAQRGSRFVGQDEDPIEKELCSPVQQCAFCAKKAHPSFDVRGELCWSGPWPFLLTDSGRDCSRNRQRSSLQRLQERDQRRAVLGRQIQAEVVALHPAPSSVPGIRWGYTCPRCGGGRTSPPAWPSSRCARRAIDTRRRGGGQPIGTAHAARSFDEDAGTFLPGAIRCVEPASTQYAPSGDDQQLAEPTSHRSRHQPPGGRAPSPADPAQEP
jgi:hypothetical protein